MTMVVSVHQSNDTVREFCLNLSESKLQNSATTTAHLYTLLASTFEGKHMIRGGTMWYQIYGCENQYRCSIAYYLISFLSKSYQIVLDRAVDTTGHGQDIVGGFNSVQKRYLTTYFRIFNTPEVDKIDIKRMCVDSMNKKVEVIFAEECKRLLDLCDEIGTKGDKKHTKREAKSRLKHKYYWLNKEEDILFNSMKDVYNILNNQNKLTMKHFYHIRFDPDLGEVSMICNAYLVLLLTLTLTLTIQSLVT